MHKFYEFILIINYILFLFSSFHYSPVAPSYFFQTHFVPLLQCLRLSLSTLPPLLDDLLQLLRPPTTMQMMTIAIFTSL